MMAIFKNVKYFIGFISLVYVGYLYVRNKNNDKKIAELIKKSDAITEKNKELANSNNKLIARMLQDIKERKQVIATEKEIGVEEGKAKNNVISAEDKFKKDLISREERIAEWMKNGNSEVPDEYK